VEKSDKEQVDLEELLLALDNDGEDKDNKDKDNEDEDNEVELDDKC
jgi:hypothetical protein